MNPWILLVAAIGCEVIGTTALKASEGLTRPLPVGIVVVGYVAAFIFLGLALRTLSVGVAYAIWAGLGTVAIAIIGVIGFRESLGAAQITGIALVVVGVVLLNLTTEAGG